jgi:hypothetical protein
LRYRSEDDDFDDANGDLTVDLGFSPKPLAVGNLVFRDLDGDGKYSAADYGVPNVTVKLYEFGDDPNNASTLPVAQTLTGTDGSFLLRVYQAVEYFIHIPKADFASGLLPAAATPEKIISDDASSRDLNPLQSPPEPTTPPSLKTPRRPSLPLHPFPIPPSIEPLSASMKPCGSSTRR